jgi:rhodanese-related sulfurtransferase
MGYTITPTELKSRLDKGDQVVLLDVRDQWEFDTAKLKGSTLIPLTTLPQSLDKLNRDAEIIAICHHGMRSADATNFLLQQGFSNVKNLVGGIDAWSVQVDHSVPRY